MDKRTLLFMIAAAATLFFTNYYFDSRYEREMQQWSKEQLAKNGQALKLLEQDIKEKTVPTNQLPIVYIYADANATQFLTAGVQVDKSVLTLLAQETPPETIFIKKDGQIEKLQLHSKDRSQNVPLVYQAQDAPPIEIGELPDIGSYELQLLSLTPENTLQPINAQPMEFQDGVFTLLQNKADALKQKLRAVEGPEDHAESDKSLRGKKPLPNGIILMKSGQQYLPVAVYLGDEQRTVLLEDLPSIATSTAKSSAKSSAMGAKKELGAQYYVLENDYQQLVFSSIGAALVEINLPFASKTNTKSVVRPIEFDKEIMEDHPENDHFPGHPYFTPGKGGDKEADFISHAEGVLGGYHPLLRTDLISRDQKLSVRINPRYYALNLLSEYPEVAELHYTVTHFDRTSITFEGELHRRKITKTFSLPEEKDAPYVFDMTIKIEGDKRGLWVTSGVPEVELFSGAPAPALKYRITRNQKSTVELIDLPQESITNSSIYPDWTCNSNGFFGIIVDPLTEAGAGFRAAYVPGTSVPSRLVDIDRDQARFPASSLPGYAVMTPLSPTATTTQFRIFAGPFSDAILNQVDATYSNATTGYNPDYIACQSDHGWFSFISEPFAKILFVMMNFFHSLTGSWGVSIILLTIALRIMMYPLNAWSAKSILKMQQISPEISVIQEKYKGDPKRAQAEIIELYRSVGANPVSGCLPMLIQMPFLIGMFDLLKTTFELRGASFIPGWIDNLTAPDVLFSWQTPIFLIGNQFHLLPILLGIVMFLQQRMSATTPKDPSLMTEQQKQQRMMGTMMSVVFTVMFYNFPSGLNIYWLSSTLLGMLQQWWTQRMMPPIALKPTVLVKSKK